MASRHRASRHHRATITALRGDRRRATDQGGRRRGRRGKRASYHVTDRTIASIDHVAKPAVINATTTTPASAPQTSGRHRAGSKHGQRLAPSPHRLDADAHQWRASRRRPALDCPGAGIRSRQGRRTAYSAPGASGLSNRGRARAAHRRPCTGKPTAVGFTRTAPAPPPPARCRRRRAGTDGRRCRPSSGWRRARGASAPP
jgi:hypothetical protein